MHLSNDRAWIFKVWQERSEAAKYFTSKTPRQWKDLDLVLTLLRPICQCAFGVIKVIAIQSVKGWKC